MESCTYQNQKWDKISEIVGLKSWEFNKNCQTWHKNTVTVRKWKRKSGTAVNFEPKIGTVPLKVGQLESMHVITALL